MQDPLQFTQKSVAEQRKILGQPSDPNRPLQDLAEKGKKVAEKNGEMDVLFVSEIMRKLEEVGGVRIWDVK